ncbi:MAG: FecR family protein, partial [Syntrophorhabdus sp.]
MRVSIMILIFILVSIIVCAAPVHAAPSSMAVHLSTFQGNVNYIPAMATHGVRATANRPLAQGDSLLVSGSGHAEVRIRDGSIVRIGANSRLKVLAIEPSAVHFFLETGMAYVNFRGLNDHPLFISTQAAEIDAFGRCIFRIDIQSPSETDVSVITGQVSVAQPKGKMNIIAGTRLTMRTDGKVPLMTTNRPPDEWENWNRKQDGNKSDAGLPGPGVETGAYPEPPPIQQDVYVPAASAGYPYYYYPYGYYPGPYYSYSWGWTGRPYYWGGRGPYRGYWGARPYYRGG